MMMNPEAEALLKQILKKDLHELSQADKDFLHARRDYLSDEDKKKFASVLKEKMVVHNETGNDALTNEQLKDILVSRGVEIPTRANRKWLLKYVRHTDEQANHPATFAENQPE